MTIGKKLQNIFIFLLVDIVNETGEIMKEGSREKINFIILVNLFLLLQFTPSGIKLKKLVFIPVYMNSSQ